MLKRLFFAAVVASSALLPSCRPGGAEYIDDLDVVMTSYSKEANFQNKKTYARPDSIVEIEDADFKPGDTKKYINQSAANIIINRLDANMQAYGYTNVSVADDPQLYVQLAAMKTTNVYYYYSYYYWGYPGYGGWYYPGYYPPTYTTTTTGSLIMQMADRKDTTIDGKAPIIWNALVNGMMSGSSTSFSSRANKSVDQAFKQSPYLKLN